MSNPLSFVQIFLVHCRHNYCGDFVPRFNISCFLILCFSPSLLQRAFPTKPFPIFRTLSNILDLLIWTNSTQCEFQPPLAVIFLPVEHFRVKVSDGLVRFPNCTVQFYQSRGWGPWLALDCLSTDSLLISTDFILTSSNSTDFYWLSSGFFWVSTDFYWLFWLFPDFYWIFTDSLTFYWLFTDFLLTSHLPPKTYH